MKAGAHAPPPVAGEEKGRRLGAEMCFRHASPVLSRKGRGVAAAIVALSLSACAVGPDFKRPAAPVTPGYATAGDDLPRSTRVEIGGQVAQSWWSAFHSPALDALMRQALVGNPTLQSTDALLGQARAELAIAHGQQLPQADLQLDVERQRFNFTTLGLAASSFPGVDNNPQLNLYSVGATVSYALDVFGEQRRNTESAKARVEAQEHQLDAAYLTLTGQIATQAALIAAVHAEVDSVNGMLEADRRDIALVRSAQRVGGVAEEARVNADAQSAVDASFLPPLQQQLAQARHALAQLEGQAPASYAPPDFTLAELPFPSAIPVSIPADLVRQRPDILQAEATLHAATAFIGVQTAKLYPNINLSAALTQSALIPGSIFNYGASAYTLGAGLAQPLFHGGQLQAQRREAVEAARARLADYQTVVLRAFTQVADLLAALAHDEGAMAAQQHSLASAQATLRLDMDAYREGGQGLLPVVDAQRQVNVATYRLTQASAQRYLDAIQLFVATGRGWTAAPKGLAASVTARGSAFAALDR